MNKEQFITVTKWQDETFTKGTLLSYINHLEEEVVELKKNTENKQYTQEEIADCFLLLFAICNKCKLNYEDVVTLIDEKMKINRNRQWGKVNEKGYVKHIE